MVYKKITTKIIYIYLPTNYLSKSFYLLTNIKNITKKWQGCQIYIVPVPPYGTITVTCNNISWLSIQGIVCAKIKEAKG